MKHSKITAIVLTLCMLVTLMVVAPTAASATTTDANLVKDASFEALGATEEWDGAPWTRVIPGGEPASTATLTPVTTEKVSGTYSMRFKAENNSNKSTHYLSQNLGSFELGTQIKMSLKAKVVQNEMETGYVRLIARQGGPISGNNGIAVIANPTTTASTEWTEYTVTTYMIEADKVGQDQYITFEISGAKNFEIYLDDFKVEIVKPFVKNGDFESGTTSWSKKNTSSIKTEDGNSYIEITDAMGGDGANSDRAWVSQDIKGLNPNKTYVLTFEFKAEGSYAYVDLLNVDSTFHSTNIFTNTDTNGQWKKYSYTWTQKAATNKISIRLMCLNSTKDTADASAMFDNVAIREADPAGQVKNGGFEYELYGWTSMLKDGAIEIEKVGNNSVVKISDTTGGESQTWISQTVSGLKAGGKYMLTFDALSNGPYTHCDGLISMTDTGGVWKSFQLPFKLAADATTKDIRLMCYNKSDAEDAYVLFDNVVLREIDIDINGGFDYGLNGMGSASGKDGNITSSVGFWNPSSATCTQVDGGMAGTKALQVVKNDGANYAQIKQDAVAVESGAKYIFTVYVKPGEDFVPLDSGAQYYIAASNAVGGTKSDYPTKKLKPGDGWTPFYLLFTANGTSTTLTFRTYGSGAILFDNFSLRKIDSNSLYVDYTGTNGEFSESLVDGGKAAITMPVADGDAGNVIALALYNKNGANKTLLNVQAKTITDANVTAGCASFELKAGTLGANFANVNCAKLIMLKGGSYDAIREYDLLLKAAQ